MTNIEASAMFAAMIHESTGCLLCTVTLERLGPPSDQFKIVRLLSGERVILDQAYPVAHINARALYAYAA